MQQGWKILLFLSKIQYQYNTRPTLLILDTRQIRVGRTVVTQYTMNNKSKIRRMTITVRQSYERETNQHIQGKEYKVSGHVNQTKIQNSSNHSNVNAYM